VRLVFVPTGWEDYLFWQRTDKATLNRVNRLLADVVRHPLTGIGHPEPLRNILTGLWSRRVDEEHRLVYKVDGNDIIIIQVRSHYGK
jgi:toxin YoeB